MGLHHIARVGFVMVAASALLGASCAKDPPVVTGPTPTKTSATVTPPPQTPPHPEQLVSLDSSGQQDFAKNHNQFYARLAVLDKTSGEDAAKCVDSSVLTWLIRAFNKTSASVSISAKVTDPTGDPAINIPLFASSKDGSTNQCATNSLGTSGVAQPITAYYLQSGPSNPFNVELDFKFSSNGSLNVAKETISIAAEVLNYTGANGNLIKEIGNAPIAAAANAIDASLSANYTSTNTITHTITINPVPNILPTTDDGWKLVTDSIDVGAPTVVAAVWGPKLDNGIQPSLEIVPQYQASLLVDAANQPLDVTQILGERLLPPGTGTLRDRLKSGPPNGLSSGNFRITTDPSVLDGYCTDALNLFETFLTYDDALVAQFANLYENTGFFQSLNLRSAPHCLPAGQLAELAKISNKYVLPDLTRQTSDDRTAVVDARTKVISHALLNPSDTAGILKVISNPSTFAVTFAPDVADDFPVPTASAKLSTLAGQAAIAELSNLSINAFQCGRAPPGGSVRNISAVALSTKSASPIGVLMIFANPDPAAGTSTDAASPTLLALQFYTLNFLTATQGVDFSSCALVSS